MNPIHLGRFQQMLNTNELPAEVVERYEREMVMMNLLGIRDVGAMSASAQARICVDYTLAQDAPEPEYSLNANPTEYRTNDKIQLKFDGESRTGTFIRTAGKMAYVKIDGNDTKENRIFLTHLEGVLAEV